MRHFTVWRFEMTDVRVRDLESTLQFNIKELVAFMYKHLTRREYDQVREKLVYMSHSIHKLAYGDEGAPEPVDP